MKNLFILRDTGVMANILNTQMIKYNSFQVAKLKHHTQNKILNVIKCKILYSGSNSQPENGRMEFRVCVCCW